jgi:hypothetical protein
MSDSYAVAIRPLVERQLPGVPESHDVNTAWNSPSKNISTGLYICQALHAGQTPGQVAASGLALVLVNIPEHDRGRAARAVSRHAALN